MKQTTTQTAKQRKKRGDKRRRPRPALEYIDVTKSHGETQTVGPITTSIAAGEIVALTGHNGSGKSTLLSAAAGLIETSTGRVRIHGHDAGELPSRAVVSYVPDHPVLYDDLSVQEHLDYLTRLHGTTPEAMDADEILESLGLAPRRHDLPSTFSRGLRQKTTLAIALCRPFSLLLVDEPFSGLDEHGREGLLGWLQRIKDRGDTAVVATHESGALSWFDRVLTLDDGLLISDSGAGR